jgi:hypothetical protein
VMFLTLFHAKQRKEFSGRKMLAVSHRKSYEKISSWPVEVQIDLRRGQG